jgi:Glycosyl hydrolase family 12
MADSPGENRSPAAARRKPRAQLNGRYAAVLVAAVATVAALPGAGAASASTAAAKKLARGVTVLCQKDAHLITKTGVDIRNNNFRGEPECLTNWNGAPAFMITKSGAHSAWAAFPNTFVGCEISVCSPDSGMPIQVKNIKALSSTWVFAPARRWKGNAAYDIWFNPTYRTSGQDTGAEVMLWLDWSNLSPVGGPIVTIDGTRWLFSFWVMNHGGKRWNYVRFWRLESATSVRNLDLMPFLRFAEGYHRSVKPTWWLTGVEAGYELWSGGVRMHTQLYSVSLKSRLKPAKKKPKPKPTPTPTLPPAPSPSPLPTATPTPLPSAAPTT